MAIQAIQVMPLCGLSALLQVLCLYTPAVMCSSRYSCGAPGHVCRAGGDSHATHLSICPDKDSTEADAGRYTGAALAHRLEMRHQPYSYASPWGSTGLKVLGDAGVRRPRVFCSSGAMRRQTVSVHRRLRHRILVSHLAGVCLTCTKHECQTVPLHRGWKALEGSDCSSQ